MNLVYIFDDDVRKRAEIAFSMNNLGVHAIPCESISEISSQYDLRSFIFAHDQSNNIGTLIANLEALQTWQPVIAFCERPDPRRVVKAIKAGAVEYVDACDYVEGWLEVIAELNSDPAFNRLARMAAHHVQAKSKIEKLTNRETEILGHIADGLSNKQIGNTLSISHRTVEVHRSKIFEKIGVNTTAGAISFALRSNIPTP